MARRGGAGTVSGTSGEPDGRRSSSERVTSRCSRTPSTTPPAARVGRAVAGEPGIGKSTLLRTWLGDPNLPARQLVGWCDDLLTSRTYGPFRDVARTTGGALAEAIAASDTPGVMEAVHELLSDPLRPTALILEDVHWADEATLDVVRFLGRRIGRLPAVLVLTYRPDELEPDHPLHSVLGGFPSGTVRRVHPRPLSTRAIADLLAGTDLDVEEVRGLTGGNPFYVTELARHPGERLPASVADAVVGRLHRLPARTQQAVGLVAVQPRALPLPQVIDLLGTITDLARPRATGWSRSPTASSGSGTSCCAERCWSRSPRRSASPTTRRRSSTCSPTPTTTAAAVTRAPPSSTTRWRPVGGTWWLGSVRRSPTRRSTPAPTCRRSPTRSTSCGTRSWSSRRTSPGCSSSGRGRCTTSTASRRR
jgi:hypothetical protein